VLWPFPVRLSVLADPGYEGAGHGVHVPVKKPAGVKELDIKTRARSARRAAWASAASRFNPALAGAPACHSPPGQNRPYRQGCTCPGAIRAQDDQVKRVEKNVNLWRQDPLHIGREKGILAAIRRQHCSLRTIPVPAAGQVI
jgi:hypothetical protein